MCPKCLQTQRLSPIWLEDQDSVSGCVIIFLLTQGDQSRGSLLFQGIVAGLESSVVNFSYLSTCLNFTDCQYFTMRDYVLLMSTQNKKPLKQFLCESHECKLIALNIGGQNNAQIANNSSFLRLGGLVLLRSTESERKNGSPIKVFKMNYKTELKVYNYLREYVCAIQV